MFGWVIAWVLACADAHISCYSSTTVTAMHATRSFNTCAVPVVPVVSWVESPED